MGDNGGFLASDYAFGPLAPVVYVDDLGGQRSATHGSIIQGVGLPGASPTVVWAPVADIGDSALSASN